MMSPTTKILSLENPPSRRFRMECSSGSIERAKLLPLHHRIPDAPYGGPTEGAPDSSPQHSSNLGDNLIDRNRGQTSLALHDTSLQAASPALRLVIDDAMLASIREPNSGFV